MNRREFLQVLAVAGAGGMAFPGGDAQAARAAQQFYDVPRFGNVHLLHFTDCHAQLRPVHFREPSVNLAWRSGQASRRIWWVRPSCASTASAPAPLKRTRSPTWISKAAQPLRQGGRLCPSLHAGPAHEGQPPGALLLDGGDTWQGSATALWTNAQDMVDACKRWAST
jgi:sulfur-oxidizing protein SoxB